MGIKSNKSLDRNYYYDNIKGFLIILVVFAHCIYNLQDFPMINAINDGIYMFHMPAFVFVSGYFGKSSKAGSFNSIIKLIFLYFVFNSITAIITVADSLLYPLYSYWYLVALLVWRITADKIAKFKEIMIILFAISIFAGFFPSLDNTFAISRIIAFYPFYMAGYLLSREKSEEFINKPYKKRFIIGALISAVIIILGIIVYKLFQYSDADLLMSPYEAPVDALGRIVLYIIAFGAVYALRFFGINKKIPFITSFGRNSMGIFLFHRPLTIIFSDNFRSDEVLILVLAIIATFVICVLFGNDYVSFAINKISEGFLELFTTDKDKKSNSKTIAQGLVVSVALCFIGEILIKNYTDNVYTDKEPEIVVSQTDEIYPVMDYDDEKIIENSFRITFSGDLILLEDQVKAGYKNGRYNFDDVFIYAKPYIESADLAIGVFEGPMADGNEGFSSSNYGDGKELYLNFPDEFADAVKNAGFDLVTNANNHLLDKGISAAKRTIEILDKKGIDHTGSYKSPEDKENNEIKIIEKDGLKFAVLSYTYGTNNYPREELAFGDNSYLTSVIYGTEGEEFEKMKSFVEEDFRKAKSYNPDFIIVLPHIGTQFSNEADDEQKVWFEIFKENGADIILGCHSHAVQPAFIEEYNGKNILIGYCPGNFANIYREHGGDASMLIDVYIDKASKKIISGGIVPLYTKAQLDGNYSAIPIYEIENNENVRKLFSTDDYNRAKEAYSEITESALSVNPDISGVTKTLIFNENGYIRTKAKGLVITDEMKSGKFFKKISQAENICFLGDSLTEGTKNGGCPWYEPITEHTNADITNCSKGGATVKYLIDNADMIPSADLYVIAIGTNDVRYRNAETCAMTSDEYIKSIDTLKSIILKKNKNAEFIFIAPWYSTDGDTASSLRFSEKNALNEEYSSALSDYSKKSGDTFINPNEYIKQKLYENSDRKYLLDHIHPNATEGVVMYCEAVLSE